MKLLHPRRLHLQLSVIAALLLAAGAAHGASSVTQQIEPAEIALGEAAQLTIARLGNEQTPIAPPVIAGLEFAAVGQSSQMESINGRTTSKSSVIYQVIPQRAGIFTIPGLSGGSPPLVLRVRPSGASAASGSPAALGISPGAAGARVAGPTHVTPDGSAFVRLHLPKHQLYVGESMPVDIEVGVREGLVAALNGLPAFSGDSFTLNNLSAKPEQAEEIIRGQPFTVLTWHSVLAAVKPGTTSFTIDTPLMVRMQTTRRAASNPFADPALNDVFNDPLFQNFFGGGGTTEKEITLASPPTTIDVIGLPTQNRPEGFSGAVGHFKITSELSAASTAVGDPLTLRMRVSGTGNFDRVRSAMLGSADEWKTYPPTATFAAADATGYHGEKVFEQAVIAREPGTKTLPGLAFSYFDPDAGRYETALTPPVDVTVMADVASKAAANSLAQKVGAGTAPAVPFVSPALRPDHADTGNSVASLVPRYFQAPFLAVPSALALAFIAAWFWLRRREQAANDGSAALQRAAAQATATWLAQMESAAAAGDIQVFFSSARSALRQALAARWRVAAQGIELEDIDAHLIPEGNEVRQLFARADEATYSGCDENIGDLEHWKQVVLRQLNERPTR
ncbi:MAG TPA: BatD family protein [Steroidobacteraceae bacterium]